MASTSQVASSSFTTPSQVSRPQVGPLPSKRGEIGFVEGVHEQLQVQSQDESLPERHPADHPSPSPSSDPINSTPPRSGASPTPSDSSSAISVGKLSHRRLPKFLGVQSTTLSLLILQLLFLVGTIIGWVFAAIAIRRMSEAMVPPSDAFDDQSSSQPQTGSSNVFIHVAFTVVAIVQLVFIERRIFRVRAERYAFKHPGEMLPTSRGRGYPAANNSAMPMAPWSRPSLPTYAAALVAGGVGTGDVEDAEIAQPPPPAYGKTRGSTLLLAGFLSDNLRMQAREHEQGRRVSTISERSDRPISFISRDEEWEVRRDADRARRIEEALAALEEGQSSRSRVTGRPI
ncbi:hypothetical protein BJV78DRAFT_1284687 [Lactifluus subvellereus]|nr:hypothetical protein BJV78DRAFT_1284687 [Lactifluus subvellereus]